MAYIKYTDYKPTRVSIGDSEYAYTQGISGIEYEDGPIIDPILENNSWAVIKQVCQDGQAENYWALGDEKIVQVGDYQMAHAIVDFTPERYVYHSDATKKTNVVFQSVKALPVQAFNSSSNVSPNGDTAYNGWFYSNLRDKLQSGGSIFAIYDAELSGLLEAVDTYQAYSGMTNELHTQDDLLFLPAAGEAFGTISGSYVPQTCENNIEEFGFYAQNSDANANRIKIRVDDNTAHPWWLRSSRAGNTDTVLGVDGDGSLYNSIASNTRAVAPCFAW